MLTYVVGIALLGFAASYYLSQKKSPPKNWKKYNSQRNVPSKSGTTKFTGLNYLVIGGSGCVGSHIVEHLLQRGEKNVTVVDVVNNGLFDSEKNVRFISGDIRNLDEMKQLTKGIDVVYHTASLVDPGSRLSYDYPRFHSINIKGAQNVVDACAENKVKKLIYTSTIGVLNLWRKGAVATDESPASPGPFPTHYSHTKAQAENLVLSANGRNGMMTVAIRPTAVYGPRDLTFIVSFYKDLGKPKLLTSLKTDITHDTVYVENLAYGHLLAEEKLNIGSEIGGEAFVITDESNPPMEKWLGQLCKAMGNQEPQWLSPRWALWSIAYVVEGIMWMTNGKYPKGELRNLLPEVMAVCSHNSVVGCNKAKRMLGYKPLYSSSEAFDQCGKWFNKVLKD